MKKNKINILSLVFVFLALPVWAEIKNIRWTEKEDKNAEFSHVVEVINQKSGFALKETDFSLIEERPLATSEFLMYQQVALGRSIRGQMIRIWKTKDTDQTIQVEAHVDAPLAQDLIRTWSRSSEISSKKTLNLVKKAVAQSREDSEIQEVKWQDEWVEGELIRSVKVKARRGKYRIEISHAQGKVVSKSYEPFQKADHAHQAAAVPALIYPIWEEYENVPVNLNGRILKELKYLNSHVKEAGHNPYEDLQKEMRYFENRLDPIKGMTEEGRKQGFWAMAYVREQAQSVFEQLPVKYNDFQEGIVLDGQYATVSYHPSVKDLKGIQFPLRRSAQFRPNWILVNSDKDEWEMIPDAGFLGRSLYTESDAVERPARRLFDHAVVDYINDGFDEIQVYWAITQLFDSLRPMGFQDPDLSTKPFHAYLYDLDISMKDNAYYTDDTINFTTYSAKSHNMARDNATIWHELGHGVMDRMMGDHLQLADTGGLSEGMADFIAELVIKEVTQGKNFEGSENLRIRNQTGFFLTNESHDDGEAYGGTLHDILEKAMQKEGLRGLHKVTDLTLETMRLTRNHPGLTAEDWFSHLLFADERGHLPLRAPSELRQVILDSLAGRNFSLEQDKPAQFQLSYQDQSITSSGLGSRRLPIPVKLNKEETKSFVLEAALQSSSLYQFQYPVTVKVQLRNGPVQGAIHWNEESDEPLIFNLQNETDKLQIPLSVKGTCDEVNRPDGSCVDFAYVQVWNQGESKQPVAKKRFYLRVIPGN